MLMKNLQAKLMDFIKRHKVMSVVLTLIIALCLWWAWAQFAPHPLGDKMEYLGKEDYGNILGFDSAPNSIYYYGTDMNLEEVEKYFGKAKLEHSHEETVDSTIMIFNADKSEFSLMYYSNKQAVSFTTKKKYIVSALASQYNTAKSYLTK